MFAENLFRWNYEESQNGPLFLVKQIFDWVFNNSFKWGNIINLYVFKNLQKEYM